ncbi:hypothetical protein DIZ27_25535 [Streptomyces sp. NWU339]|uniref:hypothetical protein n=1 Tax=Streptomyces sp. NWU339 TaxID=2185284 RepID=UPI000D674A69|nr:hypothetical protein [Streptomyces sp. NWU339]PWI07806.1 hypothetical protein DIZ27_25535 [Streptomyces sp. NWU339]
MRLRTPASLFLAVLAAVLPTAAQARTEAPPPTCAAEDDADFPLTARIHGGPDTYTAGGGYGTWYLQLTNTTDRSCGDIHPVVVLVDEKRELRASQPVLEFYAPDREQPHPVRFETTDEDELVGAFVDEYAGFAGFTVEPGRTFTVQVRLALTSDAVAGEVVAKAAVVQRREDDGDWVGQSDDYRFRIEPASGKEAGATGPEELARTGVGTAGPLLTVAAVALLTGGLTRAPARRRR